MITGKHLRTMENLKALLAQTQGELKATREYTEELRKEKRELWARVMAKDFETYKTYHDEQEVEEVTIEYRPDADILNAGETIDAT